ncbi:hypothetical protein ACHHYP_02789 [Achlya hypogyna]|uniref:3'-5' exonuclease domain-containing protein n=1 Tax=Achlya hypogyna TaxID=1202772 RepID=A0A1V9Z5C5_ACHHY|nr:hypothetical protein ACHHYP_02789 [Achlya hypogyna]
MSPWRGRDLETKVVRDLVWALESPQLLSEELGVLPTAMATEVLAARATQAWLDELDSDPTPLVTFLAEKRKERKSIALGVYFAALIEFWLQVCPGWEVSDLAVGRQLVSTAANATQTVGQLKFVFRLRQRVTMHWEASIKFFLLCRDAPYELEHFVGPHLGENLAWRAQEIERKLGMSQSADVRRWMGELFGLQEDAAAPQSYMMLKGGLFYPLQNLQATTDVWAIPSVPGLASDHGRGWWTSSPAIDLPRTTPAGHAFVILPKMRWLSPVFVRPGERFVAADAVLGLDRVELLSRDDLLDVLAAHFASSESAAPLLVAEIDADDREVSRGFVMNDGWDPTPLMADAVRYKRRQSKGATQREYEQRKVRVDDGVRLKSDAPPMRQLNLVDLPTTNVRTLMAELQQLLVAHRFSYAAIKAAFVRFLEQVSDVASVIVDAVAGLVEGSDDSKETLRMGHLVLEAYTAVRPSETASAAAQLEAWLGRQLALPHRWWSLRLCIKALSLLQPPVLVTPLKAVEVAMTALVAARHPRWNAAAVDLGAFYLVPRDPSDAMVLLQAMLAQDDYFNAEAFVDAQAALPDDRSPQLAAALVACPSLPLKVLRRLGSPHASLAPKTSPCDARLPPLDADANRARLGMELVASSLAVPDAHVIDSATSFAPFVAHLRRLAQASARYIVGVDCEWRPRHLHGSSDERVQLLQLALPTSVYILDAVALDSWDPAAMETVCLELFGPASALLLVGFCFGGDVQKLRQTYPRVMDAVCPHTTNCLELRKLALLRAADVGTWGLATFVATCLGFTMEKDQQCSDWGARPLTPAQIEYAAIDAVAVRLLALFFLADLVDIDDALPLASAPVEIPAVLHRRLLIREDRRDYLPYLTEADAIKAVRTSGLAHDAVDTSSVLCPESIVKTVAFTITAPGAGYVAVVIELTKTIDLNALAAALAVDPAHLCLATDAELLHVFGYPRGCIGPVGFRRQSEVTVVLDAPLVAMDTIYCGVGALHRVVGLTPTSVLNLHRCAGFGSVTAHPISLDNRVVERDIP